MRRRRTAEQREVPFGNMLSHLSSDEEYYTADEGINDIGQQLSPVSIPITSNL